MNFKELLFDNLPEIYAQDRGESPFGAVVSRKNYPAYFLPPEEIARLDTALEGDYNNLYMREGRLAEPRGDYGTTAGNFDDFAAFASRTPKQGLNFFSKLMEMQDIDSEGRPATLQGIYEHEYGHKQDTRLDPTNPDNPYIYPYLNDPRAKKLFGRLIKDFGGNAGLASRELPAVIAEKIYDNRRR